MYVQHNKEALSANRCSCGKAETIIQGDSLPRGPKLLSMYTVEQRGFLLHKYWKNRFI